MVVHGIISLPLQPLVQEIERKLALGRCKWCKQGNVFTNPREKADSLCATFTEIIYLRSSLLQKRACLGNKVALLRYVTVLWELIFGSVLEIKIWLKANTRDFQFSLSSGWFQVDVRPQKMCMFNPPVCLSQLLILPWHNDPFCGQRLQARNWISAIIEGPNPIW